MIENCSLSPRCRPSSRRMRTPSEWKVEITSSEPALLPTRCRARSRISCDALLVKVIAAMFFGR